MYLDNSLNVEPFIPASIRQRNEDYLKSSNEIYSWFSSKYEKIDDDTEVVKISDIHENFCNDKIYLNYNKKEKRDCNIKSFQEFFMKNPFTRKFYKDREKRIIIQEKYKVQLMRNVLVGFKEKPEAIMEDKME